MTIIDDCNRTAVPPGTTSDGQATWLVDSDVWGCAYSSGVDRFVLYGGAGIVTLDSGSSDHGISAGIWRVDGQWGLVARFTDAESFYLLAVSVGGGVEIYRRSGGWSLLTTCTSGYAIGDTFGLAVSGTSLTASRNGTPIGTATDSAITGGTRAGFRATGGFMFADDILVTSGGGTSPPPPPAAPFLPAFAAGF